MAAPLRVGIAGVGRMGVIHALHLHELARKTRDCELAAVADSNLDRARSVLRQLGIDAPVFGSVREMAGAGLCDATVIVQWLAERINDDPGILGLGGLDVARASWRFGQVSLIMRRFDNIKEICEVVFQDLRFEISNGEKLNKFIRSCG